MNPSIGSPDKAVVERMIRELRDELSKQQHDAKALQQSVQRLEGVSSPQFTMNILSPYLFRNDPLIPQEKSSEALSSQEALSVLGLLVSLDRSKYLKPASIAVRNEAVQLATSLNHVDEPPMHVSPELQTVMIQQLESTDVQSSANAEEAIVACCRKLGPSFGKTVLEAITANWKRSKQEVAVVNSGRDKSHMTTIWVRYAATALSIASLGDSFMEEALACGAMDLLLAMLLDDSDPLLQMSTLDLLEKLATTQPMHHQRAVWLFSKPVVLPLLKMAGGITEADEESKEEVSTIEPDPLMGGPSLRVVACLCALGHRNSALYGLDHTLLQGFHRALRSFVPNGEVDRLAIIDAISNFSSASPDALQLILDDPVTRKAWLNLNVAQPKLKSAILHSVAMVLDPSLSEGQQQPTNERTSSTDGGGNTSMSNVAAQRPSNAMGMKLFAALGQQNGEEVATNLLLHLTKSPLPETRLGAYAVLQAVAKLSTGGQVLLSHPGFYEFLVTRDGESTKEGREAKYAIVKTIYDSDVRRLLADDIVKKLEEYVKQGPHYHKALSWELATD